MRFGASSAGAASIGEPVTAIRAAALQHFLDHLRRRGALGAVLASTSSAFSQKLLAVRPPLSWVPLDVVSQLFEAVGKAQGIEGIRSIARAAPGSGINPARRVAAAESGAPIKLAPMMVRRAWLDQNVRGVMLDAETERTVATDGASSLRGVLSFIDGEPSRLAAEAWACIVASLFEPEPRATILALRAPVGDGSIQVPRCQLLLELTWTDRV